MDKKEMISQCLRNVDLNSSILEYLINDASFMEFVVELYKTSIDSNIVELQKEILQKQELKTAVTAVTAIETEVIKEEIK